MTSTLALSVIPFNIGPLRLTLSLILTHTLALSLVYARSESWSSKNVVYVFSPYLILSLTFLVSYTFPLSFSFLSLSYTLGLADNSLVYSSTLFLAPYSRSYRLLQYLGY